MIKIIISCSSTISYVEVACSKHTHLSFVYLPTAGSKQRRSRGQTSFDITDCLSHKEKILQPDSSTLNIVFFLFCCVFCFFQNQPAVFILNTRNLLKSLKSVSDQVSRLPQPVQLQRSEEKYLLVSLDIHTPVLMIQLGCQLPGDSHDFEALLRLTVPQRIAPFRLKRMNRALSSLG